MYLVVFLDTALMMEQHEEKPVEIIQRSCFLTEKNWPKINYKFPHH